MFKYKNEETLRSESIAVGVPTDRMRRLSSPGLNPTESSNTSLADETPCSVPLMLNKSLKEQFKNKLKSGRRGTKLFRDRHQKEVNQIKSDPQFKILQKYVSSNCIPENVPMETLYACEDRIKFMNSCDIIRLAGLEKNKLIYLYEEDPALVKEKESLESENCVVHMNTTRFIGTISVFKNLNLPTHVTPFCEEDNCILCQSNERQCRENNFFEVHPLDESLRAFYLTSLKEAKQMVLSKYILELTVAPKLNAFNEDLNKYMQYTQEHAFCNECGNLEEEELYDFGRCYLCIQCINKVNKQPNTYFCASCFTFDNEVCINRWCIAGNAGMSIPRKYKIISKKETQIEINKTKYIITEEMKETHPQRCSRNRRKSQRKSKFNYINADNPLGFLSKILKEDGIEIVGHNNDVSSPKWTSLGCGKFINECLDFEREVKITEENEDLKVFHVPNEIINKIASKYNRMVDNLDEYPLVLHGKKGDRAHVLFAKKEYEFSNSVIYPTCCNVFRINLRKHFGLRYSFNACLAVTYLGESGLNLHKDDEPVHLNDKVLCLTISGEATVLQKYDSSWGFSREKQIKVSRNVAYMFKNQEKFRHGVTSTSGQRIALTFRNFK